MLPLENYLAIAYLWYAISLLAILVGFYTQYKTAPLSAWALVLGGLSLLTWSAYYVHPTLILSRQGSDIPTLQQDKELLRQENARLQRSEGMARQDALSQRLRRAEVARRLALSQAVARLIHEKHEKELSDKEQKLADKDRQLAVEQANHKVTKIAFGNRLAAVTAALAKAHVRHAAEKAISDKRVVEVTAELVAERARRGPPEVRPSDTNGLSSRLLPTYSETLFSAALLKDTELISGKHGAYYAIQLLNPAKIGIPIFALGRYDLDDAADKQLLDAFIALGMSDLAKITTKRNVAILLRGRANNVPFKANRAVLQGPCPHGTISYLPVDNGSRRYHTMIKEHTLAPTYTNAELPNLRAAYVACIAQAALGGPLSSVEILLLQGKVSGTTTRNDLAVDIILYVGQRDPHN